MTKRHLHLSNGILTRRIVSYLPSIIYPFLFSSLLYCTVQITDPEILERRYPVVLREFSIRKGSGGRGKHTGGDGVIREMEPLRPLTVSILSERRVLQVSTLVR